MRVELGDRSYDIHVGRDWLPQLLPRLDFIPKDTRSIIITDTNVARIAGDRLIEVMRSGGFKVELIAFPGGETHKNLDTLRSLIEQMLELGLDRHSTVIALGGGIPGDVAGLAASVYMRGIRWIQVPTTLLAQVDSSVGGKTGVNLPQGKNLVGTFHQPALVFIDIDFIQTLPEREYLTGLAEIIKYGIIWDADFFKFLEENLPAIRDRDPECLHYMVHRCCMIKAEIVAQDETEGGIRAWLNLGHTFGHALETLTGYQGYNHGEAVAIGMVLASRLAVDLGILSPGDNDRIKSLVFGLGLPTVYGGPTGSDMISQMHKDKKSVGGRLQLVLPAGIGRCTICADVTETSIEQVLY